MAAGLCDGETGRLGDGKMKSRAKYKEFVGVNGFAPLRLCGEIKSWGRQLQSSEIFVAMKNATLGSKVQPACGGQAQ